MNLQEKKPIPKDPYNNWTKEQEDLLAEWSDKAMCYRWLHDRTEKKFYYRNLIFSVPVIVLSALSGVGNFGLSSIFGESDKTSPNLIIGGISVFTGLVSSFSSYFSYGKKEESNRLAAIQWGKLQRSISTELAMHPKDRQEAHDFIKLSRVELDRLMEQSPSIPLDIIKEFNIKFPQNSLKIKRPDICNYLEPTYVYRVNTNVGNIVADAALKLKNLKGDHKQNAIRQEISSIQRDLENNIQMGKQVVQRELQNIESGVHNIENIEENVIDIVKSNQQTIQKEIEEIAGNSIIQRLKKKFEKQEIPSILPDRIDIVIDNKKK